MLALALMIAAAPLRAQATNNSSLSLKPPVTGESGTPADISVDLSVGTLGVGLQIAKLVTPHVGLRAGASYFSLNRNITQTDVQYDASVKLQSFSGLVDFFPGSRGPFRITGGVISNQDKVDATGTCSSTIKINGQSYTCSQVGTLSGSVKFPSASPYVGLGFGTPARGSRVHFVMDLGGAFGTPDLTLTASNSGSNPQLASDVKAQRDKTQKDIEKYAKIYPVIALGLGL